MPTRRRSCRDRLVVGNPLLQFCAHEAALRVPSCCTCAGMRTVLPPASQSCPVSDSPAALLPQMQHLIVNPAMLEAARERERDADAKLTSKQQQLAGST